MALSAEDLNVSIGGTRILSNVTVTAPAARVTALLGPSGAGKSTALRVMAGVQPSDSGAISLDGTQYAARSPFRPWPAVTAVFQQLFLWPHMTIEDNALLYFSKQTGDLQSARERLLRLSESLRIVEVLHSHPNEVSLGQRQRAAIARALVLEPKYLLLDEVTSALDIEHVERLRFELDRRRQLGMGILIVTHMLGFARSLADEIVFLDNGHVVENGGPELLSNPVTDRVKRFLAVG